MNPLPNKLLEVHPLADEEAAEAYRYYKRRNVDAAVRFKRELARCLARIEARPLTFQRHLFSTRRCVMRRFPYLVVFQDLSTGWFVVAVAHSRRKPGYWKRRLK